MKLLSPFPLITLATLALGNLIPLNSVQASSAFTETEIDQTQVVAIARPYGENKYDLLVIEQIPGKQACWKEEGTAPVVIDPLLLNFDFTGICRRATDSNGYSIRMNGEDYGLDYILRFVQKDGELVLVGTHRTDPKQPEIIVGRTQGMSQGFLKIQLEPGWKLSKRTYNGKPLGHFYFSTPNTATGNSNPVNTPSSSNPVEPSSNTSL